MIKKYKKIYMKTIKTSIILGLLFSILTSVSIALVFFHWQYVIIAFICILCMGCGFGIGVFAIPNIFQRRLVKEIFSKSSRVKINVERCMMWKDLEILTKSEIKIFEISKDNKQSFYLSKESFENGYKLVIRSEEFSDVLYVLYNSNEDIPCDWLSQFDKYYSIKIT